MRIEIANQPQTKTGVCMLCRADPMSNSRRCAMCQTLGITQPSSQQIDVHTVSTPTIDNKNTLLAAWRKLESSHTETL